MSDFEVEFMPISDIDIYEYIKENYEPVKDKPGYIWFNKRNFQIINIEILAKSLRNGWMRFLLENEE